MQQPEPISTLPFDFTQIRQATEADLQTIKFQDRSGKTTEKTIAFCDISVDLEGCGGALQALNGTVSIGFAAFARKQQQPLFAHEWAVEALCGNNDPKQLQWWASSEQKKASWFRILDGQRPRREVAAELRTLVQHLSGAGWTVHLLMRPVGYDFRELTAFFQTLGVEILMERLYKEKETMHPVQILEQACCAFDLRGRAPSYYDEENNMESPFGFGGASQVTDIGQQIAAWVRLFVPADQVQPDFNKFLNKIVGRQLIHSGKQDAIDQYLVWTSVCNVIDRLNAAINSGTIADFLAEKENFLSLYQ